MPIMQKFPVAIWDVVRKNCASYWKVSCPTCVHCGPCSATLLSFRQKATVQAQLQVQPPEQQQACLQRQMSRLM